MKVNNPTSFSVSSAPSVTNILVSVIVPTHRRPDLLDRCLTAVCRQEFDPSAYEVIVVDDAGCDTTQQLVEHWMTRCQDSAGPRVRYRRTNGTHGPAAARNMGWRTAHGSIIAFTDDDCVPDACWLQAGADACANGIAGATGRTIVPLSHTPTDYEHNSAALGRAEFVTANCFYRRDSLESVGGFDEHFTAAWREDTDLFFTLLKCGLRLVEAPEAIVVHPVRPAPWGISILQQRKSMFNALLYKKHAQLYRQRLAPVTPWHYYCIVAMLVAAFVGMVSRRHSLAVSSALIWSILTCRFCLRRLRHTSRAPAHVAEMIITSAIIPPLAVFWRLVGAIRFRVLFM
jgi:GT2 family glycosyltransferase